MRSESVLALRSVLLAALGTAGCGSGGKTTSPGTVTLPDGAVVPASTCIDPTPVLVAGQDTGFDRCAGDRVVRRAAKECPKLLPRTGASTCTMSDAGGVTGACTSDTECTERANGYCASADVMGGDARGFCQCIYGCVRDADCGAGKICKCGDPAGKCVDATCTDSTSCGAGACAEYDPSFGCGLGKYACTTVADHCSSDLSCREAGSAYCLPDPKNNNAWSCKNGGCAIGRPFMIEGTARVAPIAHRADWAEHVHVSAVDAETRARLAAHWTEVARLEHASIASFARFALELLAFGASPDLLEGAQVAMADEIRHARIAFGLASAYGDRPVGPDALGVVGALEVTTLEAFVDRLVREACVGETLGALEAAEAAARAEDADLRRTFAAIAHDEAAHAALAWRTLRFAVARGGEIVARVADAAIDAALGDLATALEREPASDGLERYGVLSTATRRALHAQASVDLLGPCRDVALS